MVGANEAAQRANGGSIGIEFVDRQTILIIGPAEVGKMLVQFIDDSLIDLLVHSLFDFHVRGVEPFLPLIGDRQNEIPADQLRPVQMVPIGSAQQASPISALLEYAVGLLDGGNAGPVQRA